MLVLILIWLFFSVLAVAAVFVAAFGEAAFFEAGSRPVFATSHGVRQRAAIGPRALQGSETCTPLPPGDGSRSCRVRREALPAENEALPAVSVTASEAIRLATYLRRTRPVGAIEAICEKIDHNVELMRAGRLDPCKASCPLLDFEGNCLVYAVRPASCRELCSGTEQHLAYELNHALAIVLPDPIIAGRSRTGEKVFDDCPPVA